EPRFTKLAEMAQGELLETIEQRQLDDLKTVAGLSAGFCELAERVGELEKTTSLEARFTRLANEVKGGSEIPQSELLARVEAMQRELDEVKRVVAQPGPQGPPGRPGKLPTAKMFEPGKVYYEGDVAIHNGSTYQALRDTGNGVTHADWICLARA